MGNSCTDRVIVGAQLMTRSLLITCVLGALACGSSPGKTAQVGNEAGATIAPAAPKPSATAIETPTTPEGPKIAISAAPIEIPNGQLYDGYIVGGLPSKSNIDDALAKNIETAMSLMARDETGISEIGPYAASKGFRYIRFTIAGKADLNESMAWQFASTLPLLDKPGIVHSANGNRVGAIFALMAYFVNEVDAEEALAIGKAIGLGDLEDHVRAQLELPRK